MNCKEIREMLGDLLDGECEREKEVLSHLESCEDCKREYDELVELKKKFKDVVEESKLSLADSVVGEIRKELYPKKKTPFFLRHIGLAASLVIIACLALYSSLPKPESADEAKNTASEDFRFAVMKDAVAELEEEAEPEDALLPFPRVEAEPESAPVPMPEAESIKGETYKDDSKVQYEITTETVFDEDIISATLYKNFEIIVDADIDSVYDILKDEVEIISSSEEEIIIPTEDTETAISLLYSNSFTPSNVNLSYSPNELPSVIKTE